MRQSHKKMKKRSKNKGKPYKRLTLPAWYVEGLSDWPTEKIFDQLRQEGLPLDEITFQSDAAGYPDPGEMADRWESRVDRDPGRWRDFFQLAARELWKRFLPDRDQFDWFMDDWEPYMETRKRQSTGIRTDTDVPELFKLLDRFDSLLDAMSHEKGVSLHDCVREVANLYHYGLLDWLTGLPFELAGEGLVDQAVEVARRYAYISPAMLMGDLGVILAEAGRCAEADEQIAENLRNFPEDPWVLIKAGDSVDECGQNDRAEQLYLQALEMKGDGYNRDGAIERLIPLYEKLGRVEAIEDLKQKYPPDQTNDYEEETNPIRGGEEQASPGKNVSSREKIGRNDPCPCGSGKKYKKCCLLKENG